MKRMVWTAVFVAAFGGAAGAQGPVPDPWGPSNYEVVPAPGGGAYTLGYDARHWTYTQTQTDRRGNLYGFDVYGNYWTYNRRTNTYLNTYNEPRWQARCYSSVADLC
jgi:hypothetical protein